MNNGGWRAMPIAEWGRYHSLSDGAQKGTASHSRPSSPTSTGPVAVGAVSRRICFPRSHSYPVCSAHDPRPLLASGSGVPGERFGSSDAILSDGELLSLGSLRRYDDRISD